MDVESVSGRDAADPNQPRLPANRAFVVQFRWASEACLPGPAGRVEHMVSGAAATFAAWDELHHFVERVLEGVDACRTVGGYSEARTPAASLRSAVS